MKLVIGIIKPFKLDEVRDALTAIGIEGLTVSEVRGCGRQKGKSELGRDEEDRVGLLPKLKLEIVVRDRLVDAAVETIQKHARTDRVGDGKIFLLDVAQAVRIRTGERGELAV